ncbi:hypothetical protein [Pontibacter beigongshangensis]|uniref:hypothetical protein n=1 Tax=Pontibacter beigongshangensis TaxID=2574733 RepID=UPI00164F5D79|nr:hypothetical protein [Pontibacter beigongshangensis]
MKEPIKLQLGPVLVEIWHTTRHVRSTFPDGQMLGASPEDTDEYRYKAKELGYSDTWEMRMHHELLHHLYMQELGFEYSKSLYAASKDMELHLDHYNEEAEVLMVQKWLKTGDESVLRYPCKLEYPLEFRAKVMRVFEQVQMTPEKEFNSYEF